MEPIRFIHITNPLFVKRTNESCDDNKRKKYILELKETLRTVNKVRPKLVVVSGHIDTECKRLLAKVSETIPVILNDGILFFSFWSCGGQGLVLRSSDFLDDTNSSNAKEQLRWLKQELEQSRMTKHHIFAFVDCNPNKLPTWLLRELSRGHVLCLFGVAEGNCLETSHTYPERNSFGKKQVGEEIDDDDEDESISSSSDGETMSRDSHVMKIVQRGDSTWCNINLEEFGEWQIDFADTIN